MREVILVFLNIIVTISRVTRPGGVRSVIAESVLLKHQLLVARARRVGFRNTEQNPARASDPRSEDWVAIVLKPSTLLNFHRALVRRKYQLLFSPKRRTKPGPKGPDANIIRAVLDMKQRNPTWGCPRIAEKTNLAFGTSLDKDVVRRILGLHSRPGPDGGGPSWLTFLGQMKDSLWSLDLIRCESVALRTYWVLVIMDQYTRRIARVNF